MFFKAYKEVKTHSSEEIKNKEVEGERDNDENNEYVYYFIVKIAPERSQGVPGLHYHSSVI